MTNETNLTPSQKWERATLADNFIFYKVMRNHPEECQKLIEMLLNVKIEKMEMHNEDVIDLDRDSKGVRLDVYVKDIGRLYDIEIQMINTTELPERSRYYAAVMALDSLKSGQQYKDLAEAHVIFICMKDIFKQNLPVYTFENICQEDKKTKLNDRDYKHFFIAPTCAKMIDNEDVKSFFDFLVSNNAGSNYTAKLEDYVKDAKHNMQWRMQYMTLERMQAYAYNDGKEAGIKLGIEAGEQQKAIEDAVTLVKKYNATPEVAAADIGAPLDKVLEALKNAE